ncbi:hypothetical protein BDP55DRAFT_727870 [Colletotrichum godetiae]|uniref:NAD dependent epimerase/dehydratase n=1 Tax=Colletotrichum godetiae TaxID=1209918 RepID=A0AAJ0EYU2_9PEZI|nr:uncharacterized protein BDP55DRAFT_727870 [Colletotrichum godetiae]KAK1676555.1 hypothetical protein BDP55DRAFT_727870 [Colletotrichum godetiae]
MGQEASKPKPGTRLQVIGAGLPRTGTASLAKALEILLDDDSDSGAGAPVHHGGTQVTRGPESEIRSWITCLAHTPIRGPLDEKIVLDTLRHHFSDGYAAVVDVPGMLFTEELAALHPSALVICTVRDPEAWVQSIRQTGQRSLQIFLSFALFLLPTMRWFPRYIDAIPNGRWGELFPAREGEGVLPTREVWDSHQAWVRRVVDAERLVFYDVKEGWGPLCEALGRPVPGVPFPRVNDGDAIDAFAREQIVKGLVRWAVVLAGFAVVGGGWWWTR